MNKWILISLILTGCSQTGRGGGDTKFLLPWRDVNGKYELEEVTIETLASPTELRGEAAEVYTQATFSGDGFKDSIARPRVTKSGDVYIPQDAESAMAIAVYAQFDRLFKYEKQQGTNSQISWPRKVSIELNMRGSETSIHNNAHYFTALDAIGLMPYTASGVPVALNHGIVAHEHFHSHFQTQVMNPLKQAKDTVVSALEDIFYPVFNFAAQVSTDSKLDTRNPRDLNNVILRGWNEGLADLYAVLYTGQSDFFSASLQKVGKARDLDGQVGTILKGVDLQKFVSTIKLNDEQLTGIAYGQGTAMGRLLYHIANTGSESPRAFSARMLKQLEKIPAQVIPDFSTKVMDFEVILPVLLEGYALDKETCAMLDANVQKVTMQRSFSKCAL